MSNIDDRVALIQAEFASITELLEAADNASDHLCGLILSVCESYIDRVRDEIRSMPPTPPDKSRPTPRRLPASQPRPIVQLDLATADLPLHAQRLAA